MTFPRVVSQAWSCGLNLAESIECFSQESTLWNRTHFGNIFYKKKRLMARLYGAQKALANNPRPSLLNLENQLHKDLEVVLDQERDLWMLKSRLNWMIQGDRNTSFYHVSTLARRKRNIIASIKTEEGVWVTEEKEVMDYFRRGFLNLYTTSQVKVQWTPHLTRQWQVQLSDEVSNSLAAMVTPKEIKDALWSMQQYKAPEPDGLSMGFFQRFWMIVGNSVREEVEKVFLTKKVPGYLNKTHIVLIPKIQGPETIGNYKPISLCNSIYKVISTVLVTRIRPYPESLISPYQAAFILRRRGADNAIIF